MSALWRLPYVACQIPQNVAAPLLDRLREKRGCYGIDGDADMAVGILDDLLRAVPGGTSHLRDANCLELGPGRTPNLAIALALLGANRVTSVDVRSPPTITSEAIHETVVALTGQAAAGLRAAASIAPEGIGRRAEKIRSGEVVVRFGQYDGVHIPEISGSFDFVASKSVLEHVAADSVEPLLRDLFRVSAPEALMVHWIDFRDHMHVKGDHETAGDWLDALTYPEWLFRAMYSNRIVGVNRLRHQEWLDAFRAAGFDPVGDEIMELELPPGFSPHRLHAQWSAMPSEELRKAQAIMVLRHPPGAA
jgi:Methyltransferase domain